MAILDAPISPDLRMKLEAVGEALEEVLAGNGYLVMVFPSSEAFHCAYVSNMVRDGLVDRLKLQIAMLEGRAIPDVVGRA